MKSPILKVANFLKKFKIKDKSILIALSGGSDSVFLFHALNSLKDQFSLKLYAAHVDHGLRGVDGEQELQFVKNVCAKYDTTLEFKKLSGKTIGDSGIEEWARNERYDFFNKVKKSYSIDFIATGHTLDDQAETLFMRLGRGAGIKALSGIKALREDNVIRPILSVSKDEVLTFIKNESIDWCEDSSNADSFYTRNKIRNEIFPQIEKIYPEFKVRLFTLSKEMSEIQEVLDPPVNLWCLAHIGEHDNREFKINKPLDLNNRLIASSGLSNIFKEYGISADRDHIDEFLINSEKSSGEFLLPGNWRYYPGKEAINITCKKTNENIVERSEIKVPGETLVAKKWMVSVKRVFPKDVISFPEKGSSFAVVNGESLDHLYFRSVKNEDYFTPLGSNSKKGVLKYLKKQGLNEHERSQTVVVCGEDDAIVWIPGIAVSNNFKVEESSEKLLKIEVQRT